MNVLNVVKEKIRAYRRIEYLVNKYPLVIPNEICQKYIDEGLDEMVEAWYRNKLTTELDSLTIGDLRAKAAILRVKKIWGVSKRDLILAILQKKDN